jgi:hypothetical protein
MQRENYWDYMGRRMREEKMSTLPDLTSIERDLYQRIEELERWRLTFIVTLDDLDSYDQQLEMDL